MIFSSEEEEVLANTLFVVNDDVFGALPDAVQKKMLAEVQNIYSFVPHFRVDARRPALIPATLHFTDSVVKIIATDDDLVSVTNDIRKQEDANARFSLKQKGVALTLQPLDLSPVGDPDQGGLGGQWKPTPLDGAGRRISITMTFGVASLQSAEQAVVEEEVHGKTMEDVQKERKKAIAKKGLAPYYASHASLISVREEMELEMVTKHAPLSTWPQDLVDGVTLALARLVAHEARHQYLQPHAAKGLGADSPRIFGDKNFEKFDGGDQANILSAMHKLTTAWNSATVHIETCPAGQPSPFD